MAPLAARMSISACLRALAQLEGFTLQGRVYGEIHLSRGSFGLSLTSLLQHSGTIHHIHMFDVFLQPDPESP